MFTKLELQLKEKLSKAELEVSGTSKLN